MDNNHNRNYIYLSVLNKNGCTKLPVKKFRFYLLKYCKIINLYIRKYIELMVRGLRIGFWCFRGVAMFRLGLFICNRYNAQ